MKKIISNTIIKILKEFDISSVEILKSKDPKIGEYQTNVALKESRKLGKKPLDFADEVKEKLDKEEIFENISIINPGFVVFKLAKDFFKKEALRYMDKTFKPIIGFSGKMNYEFISANPTGLLHIGHARNAIVGDTFTRVAEFSGYDVIREYYINDAGNQINDLATSVNMAMKLKAKTISDEEYIDAPYKGQEIKDFADELLIKEKDFSHNELKEISLIHFLGEIKKTLSRIQIKEIDKWTSEKELFSTGEVEKVINSLKETKYWFEKEGASWIETTTFNDDKDRVLIKADGSYTYVVADIANHVSKFEKGYDVLFDLFGKDHHGYEQRVRASLEMLGYNEKKLNVDFISMVKLLKNGEELKMSKRAGTGLTINDLTELTDIEAFKFALLERNKEQDLVIDVANFEKTGTDNTYFTAQYAHARATRILEKFEKEIGKLPTSRITNIEWSEKANKLAKVMVDFTDRIDSVIHNREPSILVNYIKELVKAFHSYYNNDVVIGEDKELAFEKIKLVISLKNLLAMAFNLIGIKPKDKM